MKELTASKTFLLGAVLAAIGLIPLGGTAGEAANVASGILVFDPQNPILASEIEFKPGVFLKERPLALRHNECINCHMKKSFAKVPVKTKTSLEHRHFELRHGAKVISCNFCHDRNNHNLLRSSPQNPVSFANTSGVCRQCHAENYRGWSEGLHGKRVGGWNRTKIQLHCIDCHNPHDVTFAKMKAKPHPREPKLLIPKTTEAHHSE